MKFKTPTRAAVALSVGMLLLVAATIGAQNLSDNRSEDRTTARLVCEMVTKYHISQGEIDDRTSSELLDHYIKQLDSQKLYFTKSDIDDLEKHRKQLDDLVKAGNVDFAYDVFDLFARRVDERVALAQQLIDAEHDFTVDEQMSTDYDNIAWPSSDAELRERWRQQIKYELLSLIVDDTELKEARERLHKRYRNIQRAIQQTEDFEKLEMYLSALTHTFDPHSSYMSPQTLEDFQISMRLRLQGIGAALRSEDGYTIVASIVPGGAADKDGRLKKNDKILAVDSGDGTMQDIVEMKLTKVVRLIRGTEGTQVRLKVQKADEVINADTGEVRKGEIETFTLTRQVIQLKEQEVKGEIIESGERLQNGRRARIGVINIPSFYRDFDGARRHEDGFKSAARDVRAVLDSFQKQGGVDLVLIDLRMNGGGALTEAIEVTGLFIDQGPVVLVKEQDEVRYHEDEDRGVAYSGPLVVLCNRLSASASEIFAGAIKDYGRGLVIGDVATHGKGTVQNVMTVPIRAFAFLNPQPRGALKLTINQFYRVNGQSTQKLGVKSDVVLPSLLDHMDLGESSMDNALESDRIDGAEHSDYHLVTPDLIARLQEASSQRIASDSEFQKIREDIERFKERKTRKWVPLQEEVLRKERLLSKKEAEQADELTEQAEADDGPVFPEGNHNDEVLRVSLDYFDQLKEMKTAQN
jgi:carboxyl-terminal processing protease